SGAGVSVAGPTTASRAVLTRRRRLGRAELAGCLFIAPLMFGILAFQLVPIVVSIAASSTNWDAITPPQLVGPANYTGLAQAPLFWTTLRNTVLFTLGVIPLTTVGALILAVLCQGKSRVSNVVFRTAYFTPYVTSIVAIGLVWG